MKGVVKPHNRKTKKGKIARVKGYLKRVSPNAPRKKNNFPDEAYYSKIPNADPTVMGG